VSSQTLNKEDALPHMGCRAMIKKKNMYIHTYLQSVPRHKFLILDTYHLDTLYLHEHFTFLS